MFRILLISLFVGQIAQAKFSEMTTFNDKTSFDVSQPLAFEPEPKTVTLKPEEKNLFKKLADFGRTQQGEAPKAIRTTMNLDWSQLSRLDCVQLGMAMDYTFMLQDAGAVGAGDADKYRDGIRVIATRNNCAG